MGNVGEELIDTICKTSGIDADCNGAKTKQIGGGEGDGKIMGIPVEIKTAHQRSSFPSFQHELGEVPWKGGTYMIFVDISPDCIYLTVFRNFDENTYVCYYDNVNFYYFFNTDGHGLFRNSIPCLRRDK